jgi:MFS family permease
VTSENRLIWGVSIHQLICWGALYSVVPAFVAPLEAEFGWSRADVSGGVTLGLLVAGISAIPIGRYVDRNGARGVQTLGALLGAAALLGWAAVPSLPVFYLLWAAIGLAQAMGLSEPAFAALTANCRDPRRAVIYSTFITGATTTIFLPPAAALIDLAGWRTALVALAGLLVVAALFSFVTLRGTKGSLAGAAAEATGRPLRRALKRRAFWALAVVFCAQAFITYGLGFHLLPLLEERGLPLASAVLVVAVQGPCQALSRALMFALGARVRDIRLIGLAGVGLLPPAMLMLALLPGAVAPLLLFAVILGISTGLMTILRVAGTAEILGREGFGQIAGALSTAAVLPRTLAPLALALTWEAWGSYAATPWLLFGVSLVALAGFAVAALDRPEDGDPRGSPARPEG